jgi:hypothetical protein
MQYALVDGTSTRRKRDKNTFLYFHLANDVLLTLQTSNGADR